MENNYENPGLVLANPGLISPGKIRWQSPSNIAIVKYWGKYGRQLPRNPSLSFTLHSAFTDTTLSYSPRDGNSHGEDGEIVLDFLFEGQKNQAFAKRITSYLQSLTPIFPFLSQLKFEISSHNSFPHSSGIASSASAMSALALCLCSLEEELFNSFDSGLEFNRKASFIARLGSGSACRSVCPRIGIWGEVAGIPNSSDFFAIAYEDGVHDDFLTYHDDILIISSSQKHVSSTAGHALMNGNVYAKARFEQARMRVEELLGIMKSGDLVRFGEIVESEALTLHALMMASHPAYVLLKPSTIEVINKIWEFRRDTSIPLFFSLDAGPNLHLLYPDSNLAQVREFVDLELRRYCEEGRIVEDRVGEGPVRMEI